MSNQWTKQKYIQNKKNTNVYSYKCFVCLVSVLPVQQLSTRGPSLIKSTVLKGVCAVSPLCWSLLSPCAASPGLQVQFRVDDGFLRPGEKRWFLRYLALHTMHVDIWDSDSLLLIGSTAIELKVKDWLSSCSITFLCSDSHSPGVHHKES